MSYQEAQEWLNEEDYKCAVDRRSRLIWLIEKTPKAEYWAFHGLLTKSLFEEARYCFVYGQFLATILLGLAYIEQTLAALFYQIGRSNLQRAGLFTLIREAHAERLIGNNEFQDMERIREKRNGYAHFRRPLHDSSIETRSLLEELAPYDVIEQDATSVILVVLQLVDKNKI